MTLPGKISTDTIGREEDRQGLSLFQWIWIMVLAWTAAGLPLYVIAGIAAAGAVVALAAMEVLIGAWSVATLVASSRGHELLPERWASGSEGVLQN